MIRPHGGSCHVTHLLGSGGLLHHGRAYVGAGRGLQFQSLLGNTLVALGDGRLSFLFIGSVLAGLGVGSLYVAASKAWRAAVGGAVALMVGSAGIGAYLLAVSREREIPIGFIVVFAGLFVLAASMLIESMRYAAVPGRRVPLVVRLSCGLFAVALFLPGLLLLLKTPNVFQWPLKPETSVLFGWMFLGLGSNFAYVAWRGNWTDAAVSLIAFLVYDLVSIVPFIEHFATAPAEHLTSLVLYTILIAYSAGLTVAYLAFSRGLEDLTTARPRG